MKRAMLCGLLVAGLMIAVGFASMTTGCSSSDKNNNQNAKTINNNAHNAFDNANELTD